MRARPGVRSVSGDAGSGGLPVQVDGQGAYCGVGAHFDGLVAGVKHGDGLGQQSAVDAGEGVSATGGGQPGGSARHAVGGTVGEPR